MSDRQNFSEAKQALQSIADDFESLVEFISSAIQELDGHGDCAEMLDRLERARAAARKGASLARRRLSGF